MVAVLVFQWQAFLAILPPPNIGPDIGPMRIGYEYARLHGTAQWWYGPWLHVEQPYYRPLSSFLHYAQFYTVDRWGYIPLTAFSLLLFAAICAVTGMIAARLTRSQLAGCLTAAAAASFYVVPNRYWLASFPYSDNHLMVLFCLAAIYAFLQYLEGGAARTLALAWALVVGACLSKEQGILTPVYLLVLAVGLPGSSSYRLRGILHACLMCGGAGLIYLYGKAVANQPASVKFAVSNLWIDEVRTGNWWVPAIGLILIVPPVVGLVFRHRLASPRSRAAALCGWLAVIVTLFAGTPSEGQAPGLYAFVWLLDHAAILALQSLSFIAPVALAWLLVARVSPLVPMLCCFALAPLPLMAAGLPFAGGRVIFAMPFAAVLLGGGLQTIYEMLKATDIPHMGWLRAPQVRHKSILDSTR
jgi:hypothetical protein